MPVKQSTTYEGGTPIRWSEEQVVDLARRASFGIPVGFVVGLAKRESNFKINQIDTDYDSNGNPRDAKTYGLCMITRSEAATALSISAIDTSGLIDPETNVKVLCSVLARYRQALEIAASNDDYTEDDMLCYLAWAHNAGIGQATKSARLYGLNWQALKARPQNDYVVTRLIPYAEEILSFAKKYLGNISGDDSISSGGITYEIGAGSDDSIYRLLFLVASGYIGWRYFFRR